MRLLQFFTVSFFCTCLLRHPIWKWRSHPFSSTLSLSLFQSIAHPLSLCHTHCLSLTHTLSLSLLLSPSVSLTLSLSLSLSLVFLISGHRALILICRWLLSSFSIFIATRPVRWSVCCCCQGKVLPRKWLACLVVPCISDAICNIVCYVLFSAIWRY